MSEASERADFEAAMANAGYQLNPGTYRDGTYRDTGYAAAWLAWQERARRSPVEEGSGLPHALPPLPEPELEGVDYELWGQNAKMVDCYSGKQMREYALAALAAMSPSTKGEK